MEIAGRGGGKAGDDRHSIPGLVEWPNQRLWAAARGARAPKTTSAPLVASPGAKPRLDGLLAAMWSFLEEAVNDQTWRWPLLLPLGLAVGAGIYMTSPDEPSWAVLL